MPDETHKLQKDPPEGSREVIEGELERQQKQDQSKNEPKAQQNGNADGQTTGGR